jgi:hypothetical protein
LRPIAFHELLQLQQEINFIHLQHIHRARSFELLKYVIQLLPLAGLPPELILQLYLRHFEHIIQLNLDAIPGFFFMLGLDPRSGFFLILLIQYSEDLVQLDVGVGPLGDPAGIELPGGVAEERVGNGVSLIFHLIINNQTA